MSASTLLVDDLASESIQLPASLAMKLRAEAQRQKKTPLALISEIIDDLADARAADRAERASMGKPNVRAQDLYKECGL